jgi:hypothetical protein
MLFLMNVLALLEPSSITIINVNPVLITVKLVILMAVLTVKSESKEQ